MRAVPRRDRLLRLLTTQPKEWDKLLAGYGSAAQAKFARRVADEIDGSSDLSVVA